MVTEDAWHRPLRHVQSDDLSPDTAQTPGMSRFEAISVGGAAQRSSGWAEPTWLEGCGQPITTTESPRPASTSSPVTRSLSSPRTARRPGSRPPRGTSSSCRRSLPSRREPRGRRRGRRADRPEHARSNRGQRRKPVWLMGSEPTVRVGVIGRGFGARVVAPMFEATDGCEVVDVVSPTATNTPSPNCAPEPTSTCCRCIRRRSCTSTTSGGPSTAVTQCSVTNPSGAMPPRPRRCVTSPTMPELSISTTSSGCIPCDHGYGDWCWTGWSARLSTCNGPRSQACGGHRRGRTAGHLTTALRRLGQGVRLPQSRFH